MAGSTSGTTKITVVPILTSGNSYKYKIAANPTMPKLGVTCTTGYKTWDGVSDIEATSGMKIVIVEVDSMNKCVGVGSTKLEVA